MSDHTSKAVVAGRQSWVHTSPAAFRRKSRNRSNGPPSPSQTQGPGAVVRVPTNVTYNKYGADRDTFKPNQRKSTQHLGFSICYMGSEAPAFGDAENKANI